MKAKCENCKWLFVSYYSVDIDGNKMIDDMLCLYNPPVAGIGRPQTDAESCCRKFEVKTEE